MELLNQEIRKFDIILRRLTEDKIELLRHWRNHPKIQQFMEYREEITPAQQKAWFERINNDRNFYFLIEEDGKEIGCINIRDIDYERGEGEPGVFIWDDDCLNGTTSFKAAIALSDFAFETLKLNKMIIHVLSDNKRAISFNKSFGYVLSPSQEEVYNKEYTLTKDRYEIFKSRIIKYLK